MEVLVIEKTGGAIMSALNDVERNTVEVDSGAAWHAVSVAEIERGPFFFFSFSPYVVSLYSRYCEADEIARCLLEGSIEFKLMSLKDTLTVLRITDKLRRQAGFYYGKLRKYFCRQDKCPTMITSMLAYFDNNQISTYCAKLISDILLLVLQVNQ